MDFLNHAYDIIVLAGQSNAQGIGRGEVSEEYVPDDDVISLSPNYDITWKTEGGIEKRVILYDDALPAFAIADERIVNDRKTGDLSLTFAKEYKERGFLKDGRKILIIRAAIGATGFNHGHWGVDKPLYKKMCEMTSYALSLNSENKVVALLWHQGEHDVGKETPSDVYAKLLKELFRDFKEKFRVEDLPIISADFSNEWKVTKRGKAQLIVEKIKEVTIGEGGAFLNTDDLLSNNQKNTDGDIIHFCRESLHILGRRYFDAYAKIKAGCMNCQNNDYDIIIEAGQSNAQGYGRGDVTEEYIPDEDIHYLIQDFTVKEGISNGIWKLILNYQNKPLHIDIADERIDANGKIGDFALTFAKEYKKHGLLRQERKLLIIRAGVGGTGFKKRYWGPEDEVYLKMLEMIDYAISLNPKNKLVGFLWHQGEHDAFEGNDPNTFEHQLKTMIVSVKERYGVPNLPFVCGDFVSEWKNENIDICRPIVDKIKAVTKSEGGMFVETSDLLSNNQKTGNGDVIHFCRESLHILGKRYFQAYANLQWR